MLMIGVVTVVTIYFLFLRDTNRLWFGPGNKDEKA